MAARRRTARRSNGEPSPVGTLLAGTEAGRAIAQVAVPRKTWEEVAGVAFARRTVPERIDRGTLWVAVASPAWAQELAMHAPLILKRLRERGIEITQLRYRVGIVDAPERGGVVVPPRQRLVAVAEAAAARDPRAIPPASVRDAELRAIVARVGRSLARAEAMEAELARAARERKPRVPGKR